MRREPPARELPAAAVAAAAAAAFGVPTGRTTSGGGPRAAGLTAGRGAAAVYGDVRSIAGSPPPKMSRTLGYAPSSSSCASHRADGCGPERPPDAGDGPARPPETPSARVGPSTRRTTTSSSGRAPKIGPPTAMPGDSVRTRSCARAGGDVNAAPPVAAGRPGTSRAAAAPGASSRTECTGGKVNRGGDVVNAGLSICTGAALGTAGSGGRGRRGGGGGSGRCC
jgi:hypothetical protein